MLSTTQHYVNPYGLGKHWQKNILDEINGTIYNMIYIQAKSYIKGAVSMGNRDIKKDVKKKKKADTGVLPSLKPIMAEPEVIKKPKKKG